jgi:hypothetical protein
VAAWYLAAIVTAVACSHSEAVEHYARNMCRLMPDSAVLFNGIRDYITGADPLPQRFLYVPGTDSTPPDPGILALQDKGPTYMYPPSGDQQKTVRTKLTSIGDFSTLLVAYHGFQRTDATHAVIKLSGTYITGKADGQTLPSAPYQVTCDSSGWHGPRASVHLVKDAHN